MALLIFEPPLSFTITSFKLNGRNILPWSRSIQMVIRGKGKHGYLDGSIPKPSDTDASYSTWDVNNSLVMSWLINSMEDHIGETSTLPDG